MAGLLIQMFVVDKRSLVIRTAVYNGVIAAQNKNKAGQHKVEKDRDRAAEPAHLRVEGHGQNITQQHGRSVDCTESYQKPRVGGSPSGEAAVATPDVGAKLGEKSCERLFRWWRSFEFNQQPLSRSPGQ